MSMLQITAMLGCEAPQPFYEGEEAAPWFPFDGARLWTFDNEDADVSYRLVLSQRPDASPSETGAVYAIEHRVQCVGADPECLDDTLVRTVRWSSTATDGVFLHGVLLGDVDAWADPPFRVADERVLVDEAPWVTVSSDGTWSSDLVAREACEVGIDPSWNDCMRFDVTDDATSSFGSAVTGSYWVNFGYNVVAFDLVDDGLGRWALSDYACPDDPPCDGEW